MNVRSTRIALLGALALGAFACANIWNFEDFQLAPDAASEAASGSGDDFDATLDAGSPGSPDATMLDSSTPEAPDVAPEASDGGDSACPSGQVLCGDNGCLDTTGDKNHCGDCDAACTGANMVCEASTCVCAPNTHFCPGLGCSSNLSANSCGPTSCTACLSPFNGSNACTDAGCGVCLAPATLCNRNMPSAACVDLTADPTNCGACGTVCAVPDSGGSTTCSAGNCVISCDAGLTACPAILPTSCANLTNDIHNCGGCSKKCPAHDSGAAVTCVDGGCH